MKTLVQIIADGIKDSDWTYCKAEYAPNVNCKVGMPKEYTPDGTTKLNVETCYIVAFMLDDRSVLVSSDGMFLDDGKFYWYDNLWDADDVVEAEKDHNAFADNPIAWIAYRNTPELCSHFPIPPYNKNAFCKS